MKRLCCSTRASLKSSRLRVNELHFIEHFAAPFVDDVADAFILQRHFQNIVYDCFNYGIGRKKFPRIAGLQVL